MFILAQRKNEISNAVLYLDPDKCSITRVRSQKSQCGLGAEPPALKNFTFFCKNNVILGLF